MLGARDEGQDRGVWEARIDVGPGLVRVGHELAVNRHLGGERCIPLCRGEGVEGRTVGLRGEDDAVVADTDLDDVLDAIVDAGLHLALADRPRGVGDVDGVEPGALAELLQAG